MSVQTIRGRRNDPRVTRCLTMSDEIRLQVLLRPAYRNATAVRRVQRLLAAQGLTVTGTGTVSLSARASRTTLEQLFKVSLPTSAETEGAAPPSADDRSLPLPDALSKYVESVTIAPKHEWMDRPPGTGGQS